MASGDFSAADGAGGGVNLECAREGRARSADDLDVELARRFALARLPRQRCAGRDLAEKLGLVGAFERRVIRDANRLDARGGKRLREDDGESRGES
jgi:hypothetical protein